MTLDSELGILGIGEKFRMLWYALVIIVSMITNEGTNWWH
jgi:hypothetical protein